jgi:predicted short-subunit dehydrogenase-like oxidoreductase (DUF2520 family)
MTGDPPDELNDSFLIRHSSSLAALPTVGFVGAGKGGQTLAAALARAGVRVVAVASRSRASAERLAALAHVPPAGVCDVAEEVPSRAELTFLTVPDDAIAGAVAQITAAGGWQAGHAVVHCSGALPSTVLAPAGLAGCLIASFHPLQTFAAVPANADTAARALTGVMFGLEGDVTLRAVLEALVMRLGGQALWVRAEDKPLYHAAAVLASNYTVTLLGLGASLLESCGLPHDMAVAALLPLLRGTLANLATLGIPDALTGPLVRGDVGTVERHLAQLDARAPEIAPVYRALGLAAIPYARARGLASPEALAAAEAALRDT